MIGYIHVFSCWRNHASWTFAVSETAPAPPTCPAALCLFRPIRRAQPGRSRASNHTTLGAHRESPARSWRASRSRRHRSSTCQTVLWRGLGPRSAILQSAGLASRRSSDRRQPADSIEQPMPDFRRGLPKMGERQPTRKAAAEHLKSKPWIRVEAPWFPKSLAKHAGGGRRGEGADRPAHHRDAGRSRAPHSAAGRRPLLRRCRLGVNKGETLVTTGGGGKTIACSIGQIPGLKGPGNVPQIAGRSPS